MTNKEIVIEETSQEFFNAEEMEDKIDENPIGDYYARIIEEIE